MWEVVYVLRVTLSCVSSAIPSRNACSVIKVGGHIRSPEVRRKRRELFETDLFVELVFVVMFHWFGCFLVVYTTHLKIRLVWTCVDFKKKEVLHEQMCKYCGCNCINREKQFRCSWFAVTQQFCCVESACSTCPLLLLINMKVLHESCSIETPYHCSFGSTLPLVQQLLPVQFLVLLLLPFGSLVGDSFILHLSIFGFLCSSLFTNLKTAVC